MNKNNKFTVFDASGYEESGRTKTSSKITRKPVRKPVNLGRDGRFGSRAGQIGPKWDKSGAFSDQISVHWAQGPLEPNLPSLSRNNTGPPTPHRGARGLDGPTTVPPRGRGVVERGEVLTHGREEGTNCFYSSYDGEGR